MYLDDEALTVPQTLRAITYAQPPGIWLGPISTAEPHTLHYAFGYLAFTDDGAFPPGQGDWEPSRDREPVALGLEREQTVFEQPPEPRVCRPTGPARNHLRPDWFSVPG